MCGKISSVTKSRREKTAFLVSELFAVDVISHLSISTGINDDEEEEDDDDGDDEGDGEGDDDDDGDDDGGDDDDGDEGNKTKKHIYTNSRSTAPGGCYVNQFAPYASARVSPK